MRKRMLIALLCALACAVMLGSACGESGFRKVADFIAENGKTSADGSYISLTGKSDGKYFSAMYYIDDDELAIGLRQNTEEGADAVILILREDSDYCDLQFTQQKTGESDPVYAARAKLMPSDPVCRRLYDAEGASGNKVNENAETLALVNDYLVALLIGTDDCLLYGSELTMADLGFKY